MEPRDKNFDRRCDHRRMNERWEEAQRHRANGLINLAVEAVRESYPETTVICLTDDLGDHRTDGAPVAGLMWCGFNQILDEAGEPVRAGDIVAMRHHDGSVTTVQELLHQASQDVPEAFRAHVHYERAVYGHHLRLRTGR
jgi:hypothetical protein